MARSPSLYIKHIASEKALTNRARCFVRFDSRQSHSHRDGEALMHYASWPIIAPVAITVTLVATVATLAILRRRRRIRQASPQACLEQYKQILRSVLPCEMITQDGLLKTPQGSGEPIRIVPPRQKSFSLRLFSKIKLSEMPGPPGAFYDGLPIVFKLIKFHLLANKPGVSGDEYRALLAVLDANLLFCGNEDTISLWAQKRSSSLAHETFHDVQGYLLEYYPDIFRKLQNGVRSRRREIEAWYAEPSTSAWRTDSDYTLRHIFPDCLGDSLCFSARYGRIVAGLKEAVTKSTGMPPSSALEHLMCDCLMDFGRMEAIPVFMAAAAGREPIAQKILSEIFEESGLNPFFYQTLPRFYT